MAYEATMLAESKGRDKVEDLKNSHGKKKKEKEAAKAHPHQAEVIYEQEDEVVEESY